MAKTADKLGQEAHNKILASNFKDALVILNTALNLYPDDGRLFSNRGYCHLQLGNHDKAQGDAVILKAKFPGDMNGYYLLGEVLLARQWYREAESEFHFAYQLHPQEFIADRLFEAQMQQILQRGHDPVSSRKALLATRCVEDAIWSLQAQDVPDYDCIQGPAMVFSNEEELHLNTEMLKYVGQAPRQLVQKPQAVPKVVRAPTAVAPEKKDPLTDPSNPLKAKSIWVGNLTMEATDGKLKKLFGKCGRVESVFLTTSPLHSHAFVNFSDAATAGKAMASLQGVLFDKKKLVLKFPDRCKDNNRSKK